MMAFTSRVSHINRILFHDVLLNSLFEKVWFIYCNLIIITHNLDKMSYVKNLDELKVYVETELKERVVDAMRKVIDDYTDYLINNINYSLVFNGKYTITYTFSLEYMTIVCDKKRAVVNIQLDRPINYELAVMKFISEVKDVVCEKYLSTRFEGLTVRSLQMQSGDSCVYTISR
jgi:predicted unusual protein kinase regulating ubiquinone biosynthesis (AarF/ABC1/UbiB family)